MNLKDILKSFYKKENKIKIQDLNVEVKHLANLFVEEHKQKFPKLDFSLESLPFVDQIFKNTMGKKECAKDEYCHKCEKIASYLLQTLKENFKGDILWKNDNQPIFLFENFNEFNSFEYVTKQITCKNVTNTTDFLKKLSK